MTAHTRRAPAAITSAEAWDWQLSALCRGEDPNIFFHPEGERGHARRRRQRRAKALCDLCPVARQCLGHALKFPEPYGIWGGSSEDERIQRLTPAHHNHVAITTKSHPTNPYSSADREQMPPPPTMPSDPYTTAPRPATTTADADPAAPSPPAPSGAVSPAEMASARCADDMTGRAPLPTKALHYNMSQPEHP